MSKANSNVLAFNDIATLLVADVIGQQKFNLRGRTLGVRGHHGIGKTSVFYHLREAAADPKHPMHNHKFVEPIDCTQLSDGSIWMPEVDKELGVSREVPNERLGVSKLNQKGVNNARPVVLCFDELTKASQFVQAMCAPIVYERRIGDYYLPEGSSVFYTGNISSEGVGDSMKAHMQDRVQEVYMRAPTAEEWVNNFAMRYKLHESIVAAAHVFPQFFDTYLDYEPGGQFHGKDQATNNPYIFNPKKATGKWVTPRSLHSCSDWLKGIDAAGNVSDDAMEAVLTGAIGAPATKEMLAYIRYGRELPAFELIVKDPMKAPLPKSPTAQIVQVFQFVTRCETPKEGEAVVKYVKRMREEMQALFANTVANANAKIAVFVGIKDFSNLLADNRQFFSN